MSNDKQKTIKVTLVRSASGRHKKHRAILECLKLTRINKSVLVGDNATMRGMIAKISYLVEVEAP